MIDTTAVNHSVSLVDLIGKSTKLTKVASHEYAGACPRCGGKDRLHVHADKGWFCRRCGSEVKWGDAIDWVRFTTGCGFLDAVKRLGGNISTTPEELDRIRREREEAEARQAAQEQARREQVRRELTDRADWKAYNANLTTHPEAREKWNRRGLDDSWIAYYGLGYCPEREYHSGDETFTSDSLTIPYLRPVFTPHPDGGDTVTWRVVGLQHRLLRADAPGGKYRPHLAGAGKSLFYTDVMMRRSVGDVLLVEGEIKAMVVWAALWDGEECLAPGLTVIGTAGAAVKGELLSELAHVEKITICLDPDAEKEADKLAVMLGAQRSRVIKLPGKIDDLIVAGVLDAFTILDLLN